MSLRKNVDKRNAAFAGVFKPCFRAVNDRDGIEVYNGPSEKAAARRESCTLHFERVVSMSTDIWNLKPRKIKQDMCHGSHGQVLITREAEEKRQVECSKCGRKYHVTDADLRQQGLKWKRLPLHSPKKNKG